MADHLEEDDIQRWKRLAEEFGLPAEPEPAPKPRIAAPPEPRHAPIREEFAPAPARESYVPPPIADLPEPVADRRENIPAEEPVAEELRSSRSGRQRHRRERDRDDQPAEREARPAAHETPLGDVAVAVGENVDIGDPPLGAVATPGAEDSPRRPRRRRGRRSSGRDRPAPADEAGATSVEPAAASGPAVSGAEATAEKTEAGSMGEDERRQRGRRGGRGRQPRRHVEPDEKKVAVPEDEEEADLGGTEADDLDDDDDETPHRDADDDEEISFANWTVPSWQELIGSLYRPER